MRGSRAMFQDVAVLPHGMLAQWTVRVSRGWMATRRPLLRMSHDLEGFVQILLRSCRILRGQEAHTGTACVGRVTWASQEGVPARARACVCLSRRLRRACHPCFRSWISSSGWLMWRHGTGAPWRRGACKAVRGRCAASALAARLLRMHVDRFC